MANEFHYAWTWDFEASPEALWPFVSDTNRFPATPASLDYFGSTVNIAARLPGFSQGGEVIFSTPVYNDPEVSAFLKENIVGSVAAYFRETIKGYDEPFDLWRLKL